MALPLPILVGSAKFASSGATTSIVVPVPTGTQVGDTLFVALSVYGTATAPSVSPAWVQNSSVNGQFCTQMIFSKVYASADGSTITFTASASNTCAAVAYAVRNPGATAIQAIAVNDETIMPSYATPPASAVPGAIVLAFVSPGTGTNNAHGTIAPVSAALPLNGSMTVDQVATPSAYSVVAASVVVSTAVAASPLLTIGTVAEANPGMATITVLPAVPVSPPITLTQTPGSNSTTSTGTYNLTTSIGSTQPPVGDLIIALVQSFSTATITPAATGWTTLATSIDLSGNYVLTIFARRAASGDPLSWTFNGFNNACSNVLLYDLGATDPGSFAASIFFTSNGNNSPTATPTTAQIVGSLLISGFVGRGYGGANNATTNPPVLTSAASAQGWVVDSLQQNPSFYNDMHVGHLAVTAANVNTPVAFGLSNDGVGNHVEFTIVLLPSLAGTRTLAALTIAPPATSLTAYTTMACALVASFADGSQQLALGYGTTSANSGSLSGSGVYAAGAAGSATLAWAYLAISASAVILTVLPIANPTPPTPPILNLTPPTAPTTKSGMIPISDTCTYDSYYTTPSGTSTDLGGTGVFSYRTNAPVRSFRLAFGNFYASAGQDIGGTSPITVIATVQFTPDSGTPVSVTFNNGATSGIVAPGALDYLSDPVIVPASINGGVLPANTEVEVRVYSQVPTGGGLLPIARGSASAMLRYNSATGAFTQSPIISGANYPQYNGGPGTNVTATAGGVASTFSLQGYGAYMPWGLVGVPTDGVPRPVAAILGESIPGGSDEVAPGSTGFFMRALVAAGVPFLHLTKGGNTAPSYTNTVGQMRLALAGKYCTFALIWTGGNSGPVNAPGQMNPFLSAISAVGIKSIWVATLISSSKTIIPATGAGLAQMQTPALGTLDAYIRKPAAGVSTAGVSLQYDCAGLLSGVIDIAAMCTVDANNSFSLNGGRFYTGPQNNASMFFDGQIHPNTVGHQFIANAISNAIKQITTTFSQVAASAPVIHQFFRDE